MVNVYNGKTTTTVEFSVNDNYGFYYSKDDIAATHKNLDLNLIYLYSFDQNIQYLLYY